MRKNKPAAIGRYQTNVKTYSALRFGPHVNPAFDVAQALTFFDNGYGVSVLEVQRGILFEAVVIRPPKDRPSGFEVLLSGEGIPGYQSELSPSEVTAFLKGVAALPNPDRAAA